MIKLDIGSGGKSADPTFIGIDPYAEGADVKAFMWDLPYEDESVDVIICLQALEHVSKFDVLPTLQEWVRVLKPEGRLQLQVPDLEWACIHWLTHQTTEWNMDIIYGNQKHEGEFHKTGFSMNILAMYFSLFPKLYVLKAEYFGDSLERAITGVTDVTQRCINIEAIKLGEDNEQETKEG